QFLKLRRDRFDLRLDGLYEAFQRAAGAALVLEIQIIQPDRAELEACGVKQFVAVAEYQFHGPAPHVHDQDLPIVKGHALPDPEINQSGFLQACDDADTDARLLLDGLDECSAVGRLANRTCRNRFNSRKSAIAGEGSEATDRLHALRNGLRR